MFLDIDFLKKNHDMIHFFGLGFVQLKIDQNLRMHFYHPELKPIVPDEEIHNHRYDFISTILAGELTQELFYVQAGQSDFYMINDNCQENKDITSVQTSVIITPGAVQTFKKNESYTSLTTEFHRVFTDYAITRLYRSRIMYEEASIIKNKNSQPVCPFSKKLSQKECWDVVDDCINMNK